MKLHQILTSLKRQNYKSEYFRESISEPTVKPLTNFNVH